MFHQLDLQHANQRRADEKNSMNRTYKNIYHTTRVEVRGKTLHGTEHIDTRKCGMFPNMLGHHCVYGKLFEDFRDVRSISVINLRYAPTNWLAANRFKEQINRSWALPVQDMLDSHHLLALVKVAFIHVLVVVVLTLVVVVWCRPQVILVFASTSGWLRGPMEVKHVSYGTKAERVVTEVVTYDATRKGAEEARKCRAQGCSD